MKYYTVQMFETWEDIATKIFGSPARADEIFFINPQYTTKFQLVVGDKINLPSDAGTIVDSNNYTLPVLSTVTTPVGIEVVPPKTFIQKLMSLTLTSKVLIGLGIGASILMIMKYRKK